MYRLIKSPSVPEGQRVCINNCYEGLLYSEEDVGVQKVGIYKAQRCLSNCSEIGKYLAQDSSVCLDECTSKVINATINQCLDSMADCVYWRFNITDESYRCVLQCDPDEVAEPSSSLSGFECKKECSYANPFIEINNTCVSACSSLIIRGNNTCLESLESCDYYRMKDGLK